jgi:CheY-like chemotaxis protein/two-component sensor histidine kinase
LLAFARKTRLSPRRVDLAHLISEFSQLLESSINGKAELHLSLRRGLPEVTLDADQLEMALLNVVNNARDAMKDGGLITITTSRLFLNEDAEGRSLSPGEYVVLEVQDEGHGMPSSVLERAAEPFFTTKAVGSGTGLGLAMASGFARQSGGSLEIESEEGAGTTIRMLFPVAEPLETDVKPIQRAELRPPPNTRGTSHILVVEDHDEVLALARDMLEDAGYRVTTATSGEEGLDVYEKHCTTQPIDLLFTDLIMPGGMNGLDLVDAICERDSGISVLMTTGYNEELVVSGPRKRKADVLSKPYRSAELLDRVRQALERRGQGGPRRTASEFGAAEA